MTAKCSELIARCFDARTAMHIAHLRTRSYAEHVALNEFYDAIIPAADRYAECCIGIDGLMTDYPSLSPDLNSTPLAYLTTFHDWVTKHRTVCADGSTELANLIDEILAITAQAFYKLRFLK